MLKLIKGVFAMVHISALREAAQRMLVWESEDLSFVPVTANNAFFRGGGGRGVEKGEWGKGSLNSSLGK